MRKLDLAARVSRAGMSSSTASREIKSMAGWAIGGVATQSPKLGATAV